jgi:hypothetical protein
MRSLTFAAVLVAPLLAACGSNPGPSTPGDEPGPSTSGFNPPAAPEGYTRLTAKTIKDIKPGADITYCQYLMAPFDRDMDLIKVGGFQSKMGHHAVAFSYTDDGTQEIGASTPCMGTEFTVGSEPGGGTQVASLGTFLGGIGGDVSEGGQDLPEGVAFRLKAGQGVLLNLHYINTGTATLDGDAVVDIQFAEVDPTRKIAALFLNLNTGFNVPANGRTDSTIDCVAGSNVEILMLSNHMHEYGTSAKTEVIRADSGAVEVLKDDPQWTYEMQFNAEYTRWPVENPFVLRAGDTIRTSCSWANNTTEALTFPREMCIGAGFALATGDNPTAPVCFQGRWISSFGL